MTPEPGPSNTRREWLGLAALALCPALLWGCWSAPFSAHDDRMDIAGNPLLQDETPWLELWRPQPGQVFYYPLTLLSWRLDRVLWSPLLKPWAGENAWAAGVRTTNLFLHMLAALLVWLILRRLGAGKGLAAFVTSAFALHPTACESVCWAVERKNLLAGALGLGAFWLYLRARQKREFVLSALLYAAALLAKPSALGLFPVLVAWELLGRPHLGPPHSPEESLPRAPRAVVGRLLPWTLLSACGAWIGYRIHSADLMAPPGGSLLTALLTDTVILWRYAQNFLWPGSLSAYYGIEVVTGPWQAQLWLSALFLGLVFAGGGWLVQTSLRLTALFAGLWSIGALSTNLNLIGISDLMHDRYVYLSAPGFWLFVGLALQGLAERVRAHFAAGSTREVERVADAPTRTSLGTARALLFALLLLSVAWAGASASRSTLYAHTLPLFEDAARKEPGSSYARIFLAGDLYVEAHRLRANGDEAGARRAFERCQGELEAGISAPDFSRYLFQPRARADLGLLYFEAGRLEEAAVHMTAALNPPKGVRLHADVQATANQVLGLLALKRNDPEAALSFMDHAMEAAPTLTALHVQRAKALVRLQDRYELSGNYAEARRRYEQAREALARVRPGEEGHEEAQELLAKIQPPAEISR